MLTTENYNSMFSINIFVVIYMIKYIVVKYIVYTLVSFYIGSYFLNKKMNVKNAQLQLLFNNKER